MAPSPAPRAWASWQFPCNRCMRVDLEPQTIISQLQAEIPDFLEARPLLVDLLSLVEREAPEAEVLATQLKNQRFGV